jgi:hypothetical protein
MIRHIVQWVRNHIWYMTHCKKITPNSSFAAPILPFAAFTNDKNGTLWNMTATSASASASMEPEPFRNHTNMSLSMSMSEIGNYDAQNSTPNPTGAPTPTSAPPIDDLNDDYGQIIDITNCSYYYDILKQIRNHEPLTEQEMLFVSTLPPRNMMEMITIYNQSMKTIQEYLA